MAVNDELVGSLKPNSNKYKQGLQKKKDIHQVTKGRAKLSNKGLKKKFTEAIIAEDFNSVKDYLIFDLLIPEIKTMFVNAVSDTLGMMFGTTRRTKNNNGGGTDYAKIYSSYKYGSSNNRRNDANDRNSGNDYRDIIYETRDDANEVLSSLQDFANEYGQTSVSDLYELAGVSPKGFTDNTYGWKFDMIKRVNIRRVSEGYILELPDPIPLD